MLEKTIRSAINNDAYYYFETSSLENIGITEMFNVCMDKKIELMQNKKESIKYSSLEEHLIDIEQQGGKNNKCC